MNKKTNPFYGSKEWKNIRAAYILEFPLCEMCSKKDKVKLSKYIDHITPIEIDYDLRLEWSNLQALCAKCHGIKTDRVDKRLLQDKEPLPIPGGNSEGLPTDINHPWNR